MPQLYLTQEQVRVVANLLLQIADADAVSITGDTSSRSDVTVDVLDEHGTNLATVFVDSLGDAAEDAAAEDVQPYVRDQPRA